MLEILLLVVGANAAAEVRRVEAMASFMVKS